MGGYATGCALAEAGVVSGYDMTPEAALTSILAQPKPELRRSKK